jgi:hypothetical protein
MPGVNIYENVVVAKIRVVHENVVVKNEGCNLFAEGKITQPFP